MRLPARLSLKGRHVTSEHVHTLVMFAQRPQHTVTRGEEEDEREEDDDGSGGGGELPFVRC